MPNPMKAPRKRSKPWLTKTDLGKGPFSGFAPNPLRSDFPLGSWWIAPDGNPVKVVGWDRKTKDILVSKRVDDPEEGRHKWLAGYKPSDLRRPRKG